MRKGNIKVALIYGSNREGRFGNVIGTWVKSQLEKREEFSVITIDPMDYHLANNMALEGQIETIQARLREAEAFIVMSPEYNHGYPAILKHIIDSEKKGWVAKPVGFVTYGGLSGGIRAAEQLRQVFCELHAMTVRNNVAFINAWEQFNENQELIQPKFIEQNMETMLDQLFWWANSLKEAKTHSPYPS